MARVPHLLLVTPLLTWLALAALLDHLGTRPPDDGPADAIIVAGCGVGPDGRATPALARRTRHAVELWRQGIAPRIVLTGGVGRHPPSEARAAAEVATRLGVPPSALLLEERSTSTEENARFAAELLRAEGIAVQRVVVVTDSYHVVRARRVFARYLPGVDAAGSRPHPWVRLRGSMREVLVLAIYAAQGRLSPP
ncbi:MAG: YdcF family protein [Deltaproteobacteria bacterium]|nr:MAG: YdcF family protein [Deltaproteobacteria bacterium]